MYKNLTNTLFAGHNLVYLTSCHSTNDHANQLLSEGPVADGTIVITDQQTRGRGQRGNHWESDPGKNFTFSIVFKPTFLAASKNFYLNPTISLGISDFLESILPAEIKIKWPNDVLADGYKIAGILIENTISDRNLQTTTVGIGLNVNQTTFGDFPATSLALVAGSTFDLSRLLPSLITCIEGRYLKLKSGDWLLLRQDYLNRLFQINTPCRYRAGSEFEGTIMGVDEVGRLQVRNSEGEVNSYNLKEIEYL